MMKSSFVLFDLDNTLYPPSCGVLQEINRRIGLFCADYFGIDAAEADDMRRGKFRIYGTTLQWLRVCHGLEDPESYIKAIHPENMVDYVKPDPRLRLFISELPVDYILLTNSPMEHALRTLKALNLEDLFPRIWDLRRMDFRGKPHPETYRRVLADLGLRAGDALLVDDSKINIEGFNHIGGNTLHVDNTPISEWTKQLSLILEA